MELYPAIDLRGGTAVRLRQGDFAAEQAYGDPLRLAEDYLSGGARWLHVVDLDAALTGEPANRPQVLAVTARAAEAGVAVQSGGGVRRERDVEELLAGGVTRVVLGTSALEDPSFAAEQAARHPGQLAVGLDYRRRPDGGLEAARRGWTEGSGQAVDEVLSRLATLALGAVVVTGIERDGTLAGPDLEGLSAVLEVTELAVVASGGVGKVSDLVALAGLRAPGSGRRLEGVVVGKALVEKRFSLEEAMTACAP